MWGEGEEKQMERKGERAEVERERRKRVEEGEGKSEVLCQKEVIREILSAGLYKWGKGGVKTRKLNAS